MGRQVRPLARQGGRRYPLRQRLTDAVERWRYPYSHGGFEKGHGATIYLHAPGVGAVPVGLSSVRSSPLFSFIPAASEIDMTQVFELFGEIDTWLTTRFPRRCSGLTPAWPSDLTKLSPQVAVTVAVVGEVEPADSSATSLATTLVMIS